MKRGKLIVIDGTDGSGKATQTELLIQRLKEENYNIMALDFPQYGKDSAIMVEKYLRGEFGAADKIGAYIPSIFYAQDRFEKSFELKEFLDNGGIAISNRYVSASMGHQAGKIKNKKERKKFINWLQNLEYNIFKIPKPDLTTLLYMPVKVGQSLVDKKGERDYIKGKKRDIHEDDLNHLNDAANAYLEMAKKFKWKKIDCAPNNNLRSIESINNELYAIIKSEIENHNKKNKFYFF